MIYSMVVLSKVEVSIAFIRRGGSKGSYSCARGTWSPSTARHGRAACRGNRQAALAKWTKGTVVTVGVLGYSIVRRRVIGMLGQMIRRGKDRPSENYFRPATAHYSQLTRTMRA
jgi:hypothetical protein